MARRSASTDAPVGQPPPPDDVDHRVTGAAVGLALLALGYAGALQWFAPVQPVLGVIGLVLLVWALDRRLRGEIACALPVQRSRPGEPVSA